jgi:hypothetical protein
MAKRNKVNQSAAASVVDPKALELRCQHAETTADALAHTSLRPTVQAALTLMDYNKAFGEMSINTLITDLGKQCELASSGDLGRAEALLIAQAHTLDAIFHKLARKATHSEYLNQLEVHLRLALKAQSRQAALIQRWKPWAHSTGPKTTAGKAKISRNAYKGGTRILLRRLAQIFRDQNDQLKQTGRQPLLNQRHWSRQ